MIIKREAVYNGHQFSILIQFSVTIKGPVADVSDDISEGLDDAKNGITNLLDQGRGLFEDNDVQGNACLTDSQCSAISYCGKLLNS